MRVFFDYDVEDLQNQYNATEMGVCGHGMDWKFVNGICCQCIMSMYAFKLKKYIYI